MPTQEEVIQSIKDYADNRYSEINILKGHLSEHPGLHIAIKNAVNNKILHLEDDLYRARLQLRNYELGGE